MRAVFLKEISRLWLVFGFLFLGLCLFFGWFSFDFIHSLKPIHPESVVWYQYVFFDNALEKVTLFVVVAVFVATALAQFLTQKNRIKCLLHLPISSLKILSYHFLVAFLFFIIVWAGFGVWLWLLSSQFYPDVIVVRILLNWCYYCICGVVAYLLTSAILIDKDSLRSGISALFFVAVCFVFMFYIKSFLVVLCGLIVAFVFGFNSLISHKQISLNRPFLGLLYVLILSVAGVGGYKFYAKNFSNDIEKYYIFYSPTLKKFIYQQNLGGHYFAYKTADGDIFETQTAYKNELPFNYYADLKQQGKTPVVIDGITYHEDEIKNARTSLTFSTSDMSPPLIPLYPIFNPDPKISAIPFGESMLYFAKDKLKVYHHDGDNDNELSAKLNKKATELGVKFPIKGVFGRFTNLKPFDAGIFFKDSKGEFYNITIYDNKLSFVSVSSLFGFDYLHINESNNSDFFALGFKENEIYLVDKSYNTTKLDVSGFELTNTRLRVSFDPKYLQVRFDNGVDYRVFVFDKDSFKKLDEFIIR